MLAIGTGEDDMSAIEDQGGVIRQFLCCRVRYLVSYRRILALTEMNIRTINPDDFTVTNEFDLCSVVGLTASTMDRYSFVIELAGKDSVAKPIQYFYSAENRTEVLCALQECWWKAKAERADARLGAEDKAAAESGEPDKKAADATEAAEEMPKPEAQ